jgi:hypothetical protein
MTEGKRIESREGMKKKGLVEDQQLSIGNE